MISKCGICEKEFQHKKNKFCSKICRGKYISSITKGRKLSQETKEKLRVSSTGRPKSLETRAKIRKHMIGRKLPLRWVENVKKGLRHDDKYIKLSVLKQWIEIIKEKRVRDNRIIAKILGIESYKVYFRFKNKLKNRGYFNDDHDFIFPLRLQEMTKKEFDAWLDDAPNRTLHEQHLALGTKKEKISWILKIYNVKPKRVIFPDKESKFEREFREFLESKSIDHEVQFSYGKYIIDFKIGEFLIELFGDYWHCNPKIYEKPISLAQRNKLRIDKEKEIFIKHKNEFSYLWIWETDFEKHKVEVLRDLFRVIKGEVYATNYINR